MIKAFSGKRQGGLDVLPFKLGIILTELIPGYAFCDLLQNNRDRNTGSFDHRFTVTDLRFQLAFYGLLIRENLDLEVNSGYLVYTRSRNKLVEVELNQQTYDQLQNVIEDFLEVVQKGKHPPPPPTKSKARCADCCYGNLCEKVI